MARKFDEENQNKELNDLKRQEEEDLIASLAPQYGLTAIDLSHMGIDNEALRAIPEDEARKFEVGPFKLLGKSLHVGIRSPREELVKEITDKLVKKGYEPTFYMISKVSLEKVWGRYKEISFAETSKAGGLDIDGSILEELGKKISTITDIDKLIEESSKEKGTHKISKMIETILAGAISIKASDIHIEPEEERGRLRFRLDGVLQDVLFFDLETYHLLNSRLKLLSGMKLTSKTAQDGRFSIQMGEIELSIRNSMIPGAYGESIVMRILDPRSIQVDLENMGIEPGLYKIIKEEIDKPNGMILVTGPTGSGKTTTLYAFLRKIYSPEIKIITIEDPVEYHLTGITQTQTDAKKGYTFLEGLRSALRQDPDVVMVGEIRDSETAKIAVESALTGHLVFSTLHTNNAAGVIPRLIDLEVNPKILVSALSLSLAQRLVRKLCEFCKKETTPTEEEISVIKNILEYAKNSGKDISKYGINTEAPVKLWGSVGCPKCNNTGYKGRVGIFEAIKTDESIEKIIPQNPSEREIKKIASHQGILDMREDGAVKMLLGITSFGEVKSVVDLFEE